MRRFNPIALLWLVLYAAPLCFAGSTVLDLTFQVTGILASANGGTGNAYFAVSGPTSSVKTFTFPNASATICASSASCTSPTFVTPTLGAATATSLLASGLVDGTAPVGIGTSASCTLGATSGCLSVAYNHAYQFNREATAATAITYTLPTAAAGLQYCVANDQSSGAADTGTLKILTSASGQYIIFTDGTLSATGGYVISGGAAADAACVIGMDSTTWHLYVQSGTWTKH